MNLNLILGHDIRCISFHKCVLPKHLKTQGISLRRQREAFSTVLFLILKKAALFEFIADNISFCFSFKTKGMCD